MRFITYRKNEFAGKRNDSYDRWFFAPDVNDEENRDRDLRIPSMEKFDMSERKPDTIFFASTSYYDCYDYVNEI